MARRKWCKLGDELNMVRAYENLEKQFSATTTGAGNSTVIWINAKILKTCLAIDGSRTLLKAKYVPEDGIKDF